MWGQLGASRTYLATCHSADCTVKASRGRRMWGDDSLPLVPGPQLRSFVYRGRSVKDGSCLTNDSS